MKKLYLIHIKQITVAWKSSTAVVVRLINRFFSFWFSFYFADGHTETSTLIVCVPQDRFLSSVFTRLKVYRHTSDPVRLKCSLHSGKAEGKKSPEVLVLNVVLEERPHFF